MAIRDLIPWSRQETRLPASVSGEREHSDPSLSLHRDVKGLFNDVFRGFAVPSLAGFERDLAWSHLEFDERDTEIRVTAELPGLDEKDVEIVIGDGVLTLRGEKHAENSDQNRGYSERSYSRFERRISLPCGIQRDMASATFENGVLTVTLPRSVALNENVRRIPVTEKAA